MLALGVCLSMGRSSLQFRPYLLLLLLLLLCLRRRMMTKRRRRCDGLQRGLRHSVETILKPSVHPTVERSRKTKISSLRRDEGNLASIIYSLYVELHRYHTLLLTLQTNNNNEFSFDFQNAGAYLHSSYVIGIFFCSDHQTFMSSCCRIDDDRFPTSNDG